MKLEKRIKQDIDNLKSAFLLNFDIDIQDYEGNIDIFFVEMVIENTFHDYTPKYISKNDARDLLEGFYKKMYRLDKTYKEIIEGYDG